MLGTDLIQGGRADYRLADGPGVVVDLQYAWLAHDDPERARAVLAPMLVVADREPWLPALAAALVTDGRALIRLGQPAPARSALDRAERLAGTHGLPYVLRQAREARGRLG